MDGIATYFGVDDRWLRTGIPRGDNHEQESSEFLVFMRDVAASVTDEEARAMVVRAVRMALEEAAIRRRRRSSGEQPPKP